MAKIILKGASYLVQTVIGIERRGFFQCGATITSNRTSSEVPRKHLLISSGSHQGTVGGGRQGLPPGAAPVPITIPVSHLALNGSPVSTTLEGF